MFNSTSHLFAALTSEILSSTTEEIFHISKQPCIVLFTLYKPTNNKVFDDFLKISKDFENVGLVVIRMFLNTFQTFPEISEYS